MNQHLGNEKHYFCHNNMQFMFREKVDERFVFLTGVVVMAIVLRFVTQGWLPNVAPIGALALFSGAYFRDKKLSFLLPMAVLFISDLFIGLHSTILFVYGAFALTVLMGFLLRRNNSIVKTAVVALLSSTAFYLITNFGVWVMYDFYPKNINGLLSSYTAAIPFFRNSLFGDMFYTGVFFGVFEIAKRFRPSYNVSLY
jgi:hypothetical protein